MTTSDVDLVLADLEDALIALNDASSSPKLVRQCFSRFVELTQRLTSVMRREFSSIAGGSWKASSFGGWNQTTALFKELRNEEQHAKQIFISVHETRYFELFGPGGGTIAQAGTWQLSDQLAASPPDGVKYYESDPKTGKITNIEIPHCGVNYRYLIQPRDPSLAKMLKTVGSSDIHELSNGCMKTLREYHLHYKNYI
jgi:hypothetical protein